MFETLNTGIVLMLVVSGIVVGIINTLAGGGSVVTVTMFTALGLPIGVANGTNRLPVLLQNFTSTLTFLRKRMLDVRSGLLLSIPTVAGNVAGSMVASHVDEAVFKICMGVVLAVILIYMVLDRNRKQFHGGHGLQIKPLHYLWFLLVGFYSGYIYIGLGYLILAVTVWSMNLDVITANVIKNFVIFVSTPFALAVFIWHGQVDFLYGLLHGAGNIVGAFLASHYAVGWGVRFVKIFTICVVLFCFADLIGIISLQDIFSGMLRSIE